MPQPFFLGGTLEISFRIPRNPLLMKIHIGQGNLIAGSEINYCKIVVKNVFVESFYINQLIF
jgi:hypothetical protein